MVLLPTVGRDAVVEVLRHLVTGAVDAPRVLLAASVLLALSVPLVSLMVLLRDLTGFYFHANHISTADGDTFTPRFTLTGLRLPADELGPDARRALDEQRSSAQAVELLVPDNDASRARMDIRIAAYGGLGVDRRGDLGQLADADPPADPGGPHGCGAALGAKATEGDLARAEAMFALAASRDRTMLEEVAKVEHGMVRHVLRIQMIVLRYVKALLALLTTALAVFAAAAVVEGKRSLGQLDVAWLAAIQMAWAPLAIVAVATPVRWLDSLLRSEGAANTAASQDPALTQVEDVTVQIALAAFAAAFSSMAMSVSDVDISSGGRAWGVAAMVVTVVVLVVVLRVWGAGAIRKRVSVRRSL